MLSCSVFSHTHTLHVHALLCACRVLERPNLIMRDVEEWESDFMSMAFDRRQALAKKYPSQLLDMLTASTTVVEKGAGGGDAGADGTGKKGKSTAGATSAAGSSEGAAAGASGSSAATGAVPAGPTSLTSYYDTSSASSRTQASESSTAGMAIAPRISSADKIGDLRSLDRAYSQRLALLVKPAENKAGADATHWLGDASNKWAFPATVVREGESMTTAASRGLRAAFVPEGDMDVWYVGSAPIGHWLQVYTPEQQAATGCYGAKVFFYRAEILSGKLRLAGNDAAYSDFMWLARDEMETHLPRPLFKYTHQIVGAGAGEEFARREAWKQRIAARGLTEAQATGRRAFRVNKVRIAKQRLPAVATREAARVAAAAWSEDKASSLSSLSDSLKRAVTAQKLVSQRLALQLAIPSAATLAARAREQRKATASASGAAAAAATTSTA